MFGVICVPEEVAAVFLPMRLGNILDAEQLAALGDVLILLCQDGEPRQHCPDAVFLPAHHKQKACLSTHKLKPSAMLSPDAILVTGKRRIVAAD